MMSHANGQRAKLLYRMLDIHDDNKEASWGLQIKNLSEEIPTTSKLALAAHDLPLHTVGYEKEFS